MPSPVLASAVRHPHRTSTSTSKERSPMYDLYPEWGPARHDPENPRSREALQRSLDLRDDGGERPDDN
ncbi:hypothetical protein [Nocardioides fonticola]